MDPTHYASHVLMAQIYMELGRFTDANSSLEMALSHNFEIRESPIYFLLKSIIHEKVLTVKGNISVLISHARVANGIKP
eukprot:760590-Hanusia_phi.AAC.3